MGSVVNGDKFLISEELLDYIVRYRNAFNGDETTLRALAKDAYASFEVGHIFEAGSGETTCSVVGHKGSGYFTGEYFPLRLVEKCEKAGNG